MFNFQEIWLNDRSNAIIKKTFDLSSVISMDFESSYVVIYICVMDLTESIEQKHVHNQAKPNEVNRVQGPQVKTYDK